MKVNFISSIKSKAVTSILFIIVTFSILFVFVFNNSVIRLRISELKYFLQVVNRENANKDFMNLVSKYEITKRNYNKTTYNKEVDLNEIKLNYLFSEQQNNLKMAITRYKNISRVALIMINAVRKLLGKESLKRFLEEKSNYYINFAYYLEKEKKYNKALSVYKKAILESELSKNKREIIILHQGFCYSILGDYVTARTKYIYIINNSTHENIRLTAILLLKYIDGFNKKIQKISQDNDSLKKTEALFKLISYKKAISVITQIENSVSQKEKPKLYFYKGRCNEELGNTNKAIKIYQDIINTFPNSPYAIFSNRRIFVIGATNDVDNKIKNLASKNNTKLQDTEFNDYTETSKKFPDNFNVKKFLTLNSNNSELQNEISTIKTDKILLSDNIDKYTKSNSTTTTSSSTTSTTTTTTIKVMKKIKKRGSYFTYDKDGKKIKELYYNDLGEFVYYNLFEYDNGSVSKLLHYDTDNTLLYYQLFKYDKKNKLISIKTYDPNGKILEYF